jgi:dienelactone hydrolase
MTLVARGGYFVLGVEAGGTENWGNPTAVARILDAYNYAMNTLKSSSAKVGLMGYSMGGLGAANFLKQYPQYLSGVWLWEPVLDLQFANSTAVPYTPPYSTAFQASQYNGNTSGNLSGTSQWAGFLATAYPSGFTASDPMQNIAAFRNLGVPTTITANLDDNGLPHGQMEYFVSQVNDSHITLFTPQGLGAHDSPGPMGPGAGTMGPTPALSFFRGLSW